MDNKAFVKAKSVCQHEYKLNEEIGMCCRLCGDVATEIKHYSAPFVSETTRTSYKSHKVYSSACKNDCIFMV